MLASTHFDPVVGVDIHIVLVPAPPSPAPIPTPVPMPFMGLVFDPFGLIVSAGLGMAMGGGPGIVLVNGLPATNCGTEATLMLTCPHLPAPGVAFAVGLPGNDAELYFGSYDVSFGGSFAVRLGDFALSCSDPVRLPTSVVMALPKGCPVLVLRPQVPDLATIAMDLAFRAALAGLRGIVRAGGRLFRFLRRIQHASPRWARLSSRLGRWVDNIAPQRLRSRIRRAICHLTGHPVDVATGRVLTSFVDFELPGPIPLRFERSYDSSLAWRDGVLGHGWSHSLDQAVWEERGKVVYRAEDGREVEFHVHDRPGRALYEGEEMYLPFERLTLRRRAAGRWEIQDADGVTREFSPTTSEATSAQLTRVRDVHGNSIELTYNERGLLDVARDSAGRLVRFEHGREGRLQKIYLPAASGDGWGLHRTFEFTASGDLVGCEDSRGERWRFDYATHLLVSETDRAGHSYYFQYDGLGSGARCIRTWGDGGVYDHVITYDVANQATIVEDSVGGVTRYEMDDVGHVVAVTDALGGRRQLAYSDLGALIEHVDELGATWGWDYDERNELVRAVGPDGADLRLTVDERGNPVSAVDTVDAEWAWRYDEWSNLVAQIDPLGRTTRFTYERGRVTQVELSPVSRVELEYDERGQVVLEREGDVSRRFRYDGLGRVVRTEATLEPTHALRWDSEGRLVWEQDSPAGDRTFEFDAEGRVTAVRDACQDTRCAYASSGRLSRAEFGGAAYELRHDTEGRLRSIVNPIGEVLSIERDRKGYVTRQVDFAGNETRFVRDVRGRALKRFRPGGLVTEYTYDAYDRVTKVDHGDGQVEEYEYGRDGLVVQGRNAAATVALKRNAVGQITAERVILPDGMETLVESAYGLSGFRERVKTSLGVDLSVERDAAGYWTGLSERASSWSASAERGPAGRRRSLGLPGGVRVLDEFGPEGDRTSRTTEGPISQLGASRFEYDLLGRLEKLIDSELGPLALERDAFGRLSRVRGPRAADERSAVDAGGRVWRSGDGSDRDYLPGPRVGAAGGTRVTYDLHGRVVEKTGAQGARQRFEWSGGGNLLAATLPAGGAVQYTYDAFGRRLSARTGDAETRWVWDGPNPVHELVAGGGAEPALAASWLFEPETHTPIARLGLGTAGSVVSDLNGMVQDAYDGDGRRVWSLRLDSEGRVVEEEGRPGFVPFAFDGQHRDLDSGLYYNRFRYYDPELGQYLTPDPLGIEGGLSLWGYVPDPFSFTDPFGLIRKPASPNTDIHRRHKAGEFGRTCAACGVNTQGPGRQRPSSPDHIVTYSEVQTWDGYSELNDTHKRMLQNDVQNFQSLCRPCNSSRRNLDPRDWRGHPSHPLLPGATSRMQELQQSLRRRLRARLRRMLEAQAEGRILGQSC